MTPRSWSAKPSGLVLFLLLLWTQAATAFTTVVVDAGHGGADPGTRWHGVVEKNLTLDVAKRVEVILKRNGVNTAMTRRTDKTVSLDARAALANRYRSALLVSIHFNANRIQGISGYETFYRSASGSKIAASIQKSLTANVKGINRGITNFGYAVLTRTRGPAVLIECGFISNKSEAVRCGSAVHRQNLANAIARGILKAR
jgi:N-acetylmuramoyl-L-alanine amidase